MRDFVAVPDEWLQAACLLQKWLRFLLVLRRKLHKMQFNSVNFLLMASNRTLAHPSSQSYVRRACWFCHPCPADASLLCSTSHCICTAISSQQSTRTRTHLTPHPLVHEKQSAVSFLTFFVLPSFIFISPSSSPLGSHAA